MRFLVVGSEKDAVVGDALVDDLRQNAFEVDGKFNAIRSLDNLLGMLKDSTSPARALLLISNQDEVLFGSALTLDEVLARRDEHGALVQGVLLQGSQSPSEQLTRVAEWRGAIPVSQAIQRFAHDRAGAERVESAPPRDNGNWQLRSAWSRLVRSGFVLAFALTQLFRTQATSRLSWAAILGAFALIFLSDVLEVRWKAAGNSGPLGLRDLLIGGVLSVAGLTVIFICHWDMSSTCIGGLWLLACGDLVLTLGSRRNGSDGDSLTQRQRRVP
jgi:hypothetical protein